MREAAVLLEYSTSGKGQEMPESVSEIDVRTCRSCGRPFVPSDSASDACEECNSSTPRYAKERVNERPAKPSSQTAKGTKSTGGGSWAASSRENPPDESSEPAAPSKMKWRSPPFAIRFPETDTRELPALPRPKPPSLLIRLLKSRDFIGVLAILVVAGVLMSQYGVPASIQRMGNKIQRGYSKLKAKFSGTSEQSDASREADSAQQIRRVRQQSDDKYWLQQRDARVEQQKKAAAALKHR